MKIAVLSDLHLEFQFGSFTFPELPEKVDVFVCAGDLHPDIKVRHKALDFMDKRYQTPILYVEGNHDYYGSTFPDPAPCRIEKINGVTFALATLWTRIDPLSEVSRFGMNDFHLIKGISVERWNENYEVSAASLKKSGADVIVTHHLPNYNCIAPIFSASNLNPFFATDISSYEFDEYPTDLWIFGHTHHEVDQIDNGVRLFCNPYGYPRERRNPQIKVIDLNHV